MYYFSAAWNQKTHGPVPVRGPVVGDHRSKQSIWETYLFSQLLIYLINLTASFMAF